MRSTHLRLVEFAPSRTAFDQILADPSIRMGFECEMVTDTEERTEREAPDWDAMTWSDVESEVGIRSRARNRIEEDYMEWLSDRAFRWLRDKWSEEGEEYLLKWCIDNGHLEATEEERKAAGQDVDDILDTYKDDAREAFNDEYREEAEEDTAGDMDDFIADQYAGSNERLMNAYDIEYESGGEEETDVESVYADLSYSLQKVVGAEVNYRDGLFRHKDLDEWYIESDGSLEGDGYVTAEVSSAVYPLAEGLKMLETIFRWMRRNNYTTNESTGLHVSFSIEGFESAQDYDFLKMMILFDENYTANIFDRMDNQYAQQMRTVLYQDFSNAQNPVSVMSSRQIATTIERLRQISKNMTFDGTVGAGMSKYYTFRHRANGVVEFRSMGGQNYENKFDIIRKRIVNMAYLMKVGSDPTLMAREYLARVYKMLTSSKFKDPSLGSGAGRVQPPQTLSAFQLIFDKNPKLNKMVENPPLFLYWVGTALRDKTISLGPQQIRQLRFFVAKSKIDAETFRKAFNDDSIYNQIANLMRWPIVVPGVHSDNQQTLPFAQHGRDYSGEVKEPEENYLQRYARQDRERNLARRQGHLGGDTAHYSYAPNPPIYRR
jgi:hypothetical protein